MQELWSNATSPLILPVTIVVGFISLYWLTFILGFFSFDLDSGEADFDLDTDSSHGLFSGFAHYLHIGEMPFMIVLSILSYVFWLTAISAMSIFGTALSTLLGLGVMAVCFLISVVLTHYLSMPVKKLFRALEGDVDRAPSMIGLTTKVVTSRVTSDFGRIEYIHKGAPLTFEARTEEKAELAKGDLALILEIIDEKKRIFKVTKQDKTKLEE